MRLRGGEKVEEKFIKISFDKDTYSYDAIKRVLSTYTEEFYIHFQETNDSVMVSLESKSEKSYPKQIEKEIRNQVLEESVRVRIEEETKEIREQLIKSAMNMD